MGEVARSESPGYPDRCRACQAPLRGPYCHECGQGHRYGRLSIRALLEGFIESLVELDSRAVRTFWGLTIAPGRVVREYLDGRRIVYVNPFKYALVAVTVAFLVIPWMLELVSGPVPENDASISALSKFLNLAGMPLMALVFRGLHWRNPLRFIEYFVLVLLVLGHVFLIQTVLNVLFLLVLPQARLVILVVPIIWLTWGLRGVIGGGWLVNLGRSVVTMVVVHLVTNGVARLWRPDLMS